MMLMPLVVDDLSSGFFVVFFKPVVVAVVVDVVIVVHVQLEYVVRIKGREKITGTLLLFATHFIFVDGKGEELWVS